VLDTLAVETDADLFTQTPAASAGDLASLEAVLPPAATEPSPSGTGAAVSARELGEGEARLATWRQLLDEGSLQEGEPHLAGTARAVVARLSAATARQVGDTVTVSTARGEITLPVEVADLPDDVVWLPANSVGSRVRRALGAGHGDVVSIKGGVR
jgi:NADH-quinone oxidoreductase subunit G